MEGMTQKGETRSRRSGSGLTVQERQVIEGAARALARTGDPRALSEHLADQIVNMCAHLDVDPEPVLEALRATLRKRLKT
jgi:hypothetical protein